MNGKHDALSGDLNAALTPSDAEAQFRVSPLDAFAEASLQMLSAGMDVVRDVLPPAISARFPADIAGHAFAHTWHLTRELRRLAHSVVAYVLDDTPARDSAASLAEVAGAVDNLAAELLREKELPPRRATPALTRDALPNIEGLIGEAALEHFGAASRLGFHGGPRTLAWVPVAPERAFVASTERVYLHLELYAAVHVLGSLEREASRWEFLCFTDAPSATGYAFHQRIREQEWSLVERDTLIFGMPFLDALRESEAFSELTDLQQRVTQALAGSVTGIFRVEERSGSHTFLHDALASGRIDMFEHNEVIEYGPGDLLFGRILPVENGVYLRSPGSVFTGFATERNTIEMTNALEELCDSLPRSVALEAILTRLMLGREVPRAVAPAASRAEARKMTERFFEAMIAEGKDDVVAVPESLSAASQPREARGFDVDGTVGEWLDALKACAEAGGRRSGRARRKRRR